MYKVIVLYGSIISAVKAGNVPEMTQYNAIIPNCDSSNSVKILLS
jgi:hypothetical protein